MANRVSKRRLKGVAVYLTRKVYDAWLESLTAKELSMVMLPVHPSDLKSLDAGDRKDYQTITMQMPSWWVVWYKNSLSREDKFRFAKLVEQRLQDIGLLGDDA